MAKHCVSQPGSFHLMLKKGTNLNDLLIQIINPQDKKAKLTPEQIIAQIKDKLKSDVPQNEIDKFTQQFFSTNTPLILLQMLPQVSFEAKTNISIIFAFFTKGLQDNGQNVGPYQPMLDYMEKHSSKVFGVLLPQMQSDYSQIVFQILQQFAQVKSLQKILLQTLAQQKFEQLFQIINSTQFQQSLDGCNILRTLLSSHVKEVVIPFLKENLQFFQWFIIKISGNKNHVSKLNNMQLLCDMILTEDFRAQMTEFVSHTTNLKAVMKILIDNHPEIQAEAYHLFKMFLASPDIPEGVRKILVENKELLVQCIQEIDNSDIDAEKREVIQILLDLH